MTERSDTVNQRGGWGTAGMAGQRCWEGCPCMHVGADTDTLGAGCIGASSVALHAARSDAPVSLSAAVAAQHERAGFAPCPFPPAPPPPFVMRLRLLRWLGAARAVGTIVGCGDVYVCSPHHVHASCARACALPAQGGSDPGLSCGRL